MSGEDHAVPDGEAGLPPDEEEVEDRDEKARPPGPRARRPAAISFSHSPVLRRWAKDATKKIIGQPRPTSRRRLPVKFAVMLGTSWRQAMSASTANSGRVWSQARMARARPWLMKNCATSAPQAMTNAEKRTDGKVQSAGQAPRLAVAARPLRRPAREPRGHAASARQHPPSRPPAVDVDEARPRAIEQRVPAEARVVGLREVGAEVTAAALFAEERRARHGPGHVREVAGLGRGAARGQRRGRAAAQRSRTVEERPQARARRARGRGSAQARPAQLVARVRRPRARPARGGAGSGSAVGRAPGSRRPPSPRPPGRRRPGPRAASCWPGGSRRGRRCPPPRRRRRGRAAWCGRGGRWPRRPSRSAPPGSRAPARA